jgi:phosphorylcholine metabolism protein LicD
VYEISYHVVIKCAFKPKIRPSDEDSAITQHVQALIHSSGMMLEELIVKVVEMAVS